MPGTLFVVGTPIGNLEDLTFRALRVLREADLLAAEDTRRTAHLLARYELRKPLVSLREHNETRETPRLVEKMSAGASIALVSDAGTPGISDPGARFVNATRKAGIPVIAIPGPSAVTAALSVSGLPADRFVFMGFPPSSGKARTSWFNRLAGETSTVVFFESPHRIQRTLSDLKLVKRPILVHKELTKIHEISVEYQSSLNGAEELTKGEYTIVVAPRAEEHVSVDEKAIYSMYSSLTAGVPVDRALALELVSSAFRLDLAQVKKVVKKMSILVKQHKTSPA